MTILITGANGLLGQHLIKILMEKDHRIAATGKSASRLPEGQDSHYHYYSADITDEQALHAVIGKVRPDVVVHALLFPSLAEDRP
jgi:dTDP-4-dehydrorhamnose reductase